MASVKINEVTKVTPSFSDQSMSEFTLPLTFFDTIWFKFSPVERLFFFEINDLTPQFFNSAVLPKLKHSLSITLFHYLPLAGNLMWPPDAEKPAIYYFPGDGVSLTVAESATDFSFLSGNGFREAVEFPPLTPELLTSDDKSAAIAIQITLFPNQGFCIGISTHHAFLDGKSSTMFIKSWAHLCKQDKEDPSLLPELTPSFDRSAIKDPDGKDMVYVKNWLRFSGSDSNTNKRSVKVMSSSKEISNLVLATFVLTGEDVKKLRDRILSEVKESKQLHLSTFVISCAYAFFCIIKAKREEGNTNILFAFQADYRIRLDPPIPPNYCGNCVGSQAVVAKAGEFMDENGVSFVVEKLSDLVKGVQRGVEGLTLEKLIEMMSIGVKGLGVAGSNRFDVYGMNFGWGRPKKVETVSIVKTGAISLAESRDGSSGVEIGVVLQKQEMEVFASLFVNWLKC